MTDIAATTPPTRSWAKPCGVALVSLIALLLIVMPILKYESLHTNFYDLGQYATFHYAIAFNGSWGDLFSTHAHPIAAPYVLLYRVLPSNLTLLVLQSAVVVLSGFIFLSYWRRLQLPFPIAGLLLYFLSFSIWFAALFEFHFEHLVLPILFGFFLVLEREDSIPTRLLAFMLGLLLCLVKEVYPLTAAMLGVYLILRKRWYATGIILTVVALGYFVLMTKVVIPHFSQNAETGELWGSAFGYLGKNTTQMLQSLLRDPMILVRELAHTPRKVLYAAVLFGSLALLPLRRPLVLLPVIPTLGISLLSHNPNHFYLGHQYTLAIIAICLVAVAQALKGMRHKMQAGWLAAMLICTIVTQVAFGPSPISRLFWAPNIFTYNWHSYFQTNHDRKLRAAINRFVTPDDKAIVSTQNAVNIDRISNRVLTYAFPYGVFDESKSVNGTTTNATTAGVAQFVVLDRHRPLSLLDRICLFDRKAICTDEAFIQEFDEAIERMKTAFEILYDHDGIIIARRRS